MGMDDISKSEKQDEKERMRPSARVRKRVDGGKRRFDMRRFTSEQNMLSCAPWHWEPGDVIHVMTGGDIDFLTFIRCALRQQRAEYLLVSSWCYGVEDVKEIISWLERGVVGRLDCYMGEIATASYAMCQRDLERAAEGTGGRCGVFKNHSKVAVILGESFDCAICSSANVNTNPRTENTIITCDSDIALFYKNYFDGVNVFNRRKTKWEPYERSSKSSPV